MVRHNNMIPNGHFHKKWKEHVKINFDQQFRKRRRHAQRNRKLRKLTPRPYEYLRPLVHCPSVRYNLKVRAGRGFTLAELKAIKMPLKKARTLGIAVDHRRRNKSVEAMQGHVQRLKLYLSKLIVYPKKDRKKQEAGVPAPVAVTKVLGINKIGQAKGHEKPRMVQEEDKKFRAFERLRRARGEVKMLRKRKQKNKEDDILAPIKLKGKGED